MMKVIGITGGVGCGKSSLLKLIKQKSNSYILRTDELAKSLEKKGEVCYEPLVELLGANILDKDMEIVPEKMAKAIFEDDPKSVLKRVNDIIHPKVKERILAMINELSDSGEYDFFFIEAALLIEEHYEKICDELWYIYADESTRIKRLKDSRGYSDEKIKSIMASQLDDGTFRKYCKIVINNNGTMADTEDQLDRLLVKRG